MVLTRLRRLSARWLCAAPYSKAKDPAPCGVYDGVKNTMESAMDRTDDWKGKGRPYELEMPSQHGIAWHKVNDGDIHKAMHLPVLFCVTISTCFNTSIHRLSAS